MPPPETPAALPCLEHRGELNELHATTRTLTESVEQMRGCLLGTLDGKPGILAKLDRQTFVIIGATAILQLIVFAFSSGLIHWR